MARIRSIHPGLFTDEAFVSLSDAARIFLIGLWTEADDHGVFEWKPLTLKMRLRPNDPQPIDDLLAEIEAVRVIARFEEDGRAYGAIRNFTTYQRPKKPQIKYPIPDDMRKFVGLEGAPSGDEPMRFTRDATAAERQRAKRERDKSETRHASTVTNVDEGGTCHGLTVTGTEPVPNQFLQSAELSRQMEDGGGNRRVERKEDAAEAALAIVPPPEPETIEAELYRRGIELFGRTSGGLITRARKALGDTKSLALVIEARAKHNPKQWFAGAVQRAEKPPNDAAMPPGSWVEGERGARTF